MTRAQQIKVVKVTWAKEIEEEQWIPKGQFLIKAGISKQLAVVAEKAIVKMTDTKMNGR